MIIALLLDLLEIEYELIIEDYLLSYSDTNRDYVDFVFKIIDEEYGGSENFLIHHCNVSKESINIIKEVLVVK